MTQLGAVAVPVEEPHLSTDQHFRELLFGLLKGYYDIAPPTAVLMS